MFHVIKYPEDNLKEVLPPGLLELVAIGFHDFKHDGQASGTFTSTYYKTRTKGLRHSGACIFMKPVSFMTSSSPSSHIQLAPSDDRGEFKHDREPSFDPHTVRVTLVFFTQNKHL